MSVKKEAGFPFDPEECGGNVPHPLTMITIHRLNPFVLALVLLLGAEDVRAHATGESYVFLDVHPTALVGHAEIRFEDLEKKLGLQQGEQDPKAFVVANEEVVRDYIRDHFKVRDGDEVYELVFASSDVLELPQGLFAIYNLRMTKDPLPDKLTVESRMLFEDDPRHRNLLVINKNAKTGESRGPEATALIFGPDTAVQELDLLNISGLMRLRGFIWQGTLHIWIGIDHILFLIALILPAVLDRRDGAWHPVPTFRRAFWRILKIVTLFTVAHSITLSLTALDFIRLPSPVVESIIALSIVVIALNNLFPIWNDKTWMLILGFGLFHGMGFASVMAHLPFRMNDLVSVVLNFNIGVELGQVAIVAVAFPLLYLMRRSPWFTRGVLGGGSLVVGVVALFWFVERAFGLG